jgi:hypothetical protein
VYKTVDNALFYITDKTKLAENIQPYYFACGDNPHFAAKDFMMFFNRSYSPNSNLRKVQAKHIYQSFAPGEVTPEQANLIGKQLANELLGGEYSYVLATHVDKGHIHNHIVFANVSFVNFKTFETNKNRYKESWKDVRAISDRLCKEYGLSIIQTKDDDKEEKKYSENYFKYTGIDPKKSWKNKLKKLINFSIGECKNFDDFLEFMKSNGVEVVYRPDNEVKLKFRMTGQQKFTRAKTLGSNYDVSAIVRRIADYQVFLTGEGNNTKSKLIDTDTEKMQNSPFLKRWAEHRNALELAELVNKFTADNSAKQTQGKALIVQIDTLNSEIEYINSLIFSTKQRKVAEDVLKEEDKNLLSVENLKENRDKLIKERNALQTRQRELKYQISELSSQRRELEEFLRKQGVEINRENSEKTVAKSDKTRYNNYEIQY